MTMIICNKVCAIMVMINCSKLCANLQEKSTQLTLCQRCKSEILRLYSIAYVAKESMKMSNFTSLD